MAKITVINPFSGAQVDRDVATIDPQAIANLMTDDDLSACEGQGNDDAEWVEYVALHLGAERMGVLVLS